MGLLVGCTLLQVLFVRTTEIGMAVTLSHNLIFIVPMSLHPVGKVMSLFSSREPTIECTKPVVHVGQGEVGGLVIGAPHQQWVDSNSLQ